MTKNELRETTDRIIGRDSSTMTEQEIDEALQEVQLSDPGDRGIMAGYLRDYRAAD